MRILIVVHGYPPQASGGSEVYAELQARTLREQHGDEVLVLTREADPRAPEYAVRRDEVNGVAVVRINNTFREVTSFEESYTQPRIADEAARIIAAFAPDVAHVHHLTCLSTRIPALLASAGVPCVMTLHDYWLLCHRGQLLDRDLRVCAGPDGGCTRCVDAAVAAPAALRLGARLVRTLDHTVPPAVMRLVRQAGTAVAGAASTQDALASETMARLRHMREMCGHVTRFLAPSEALRQRFIDFGIAPSRIELSPYGFDVGLFESGRARVRGPRFPLRAGFIGSLMVSKAPHLLLEAAATLPQGRIAVELFGAHTAYHGDDSYRAQLEPLLHRPGVTVHGPRPHETMPEALAGLDVLVVPSIWPENSPLVIQEALLAGVVPVAADIGGIPELVQHERNGLLCPPGDAQAFGRALSRLLEEPGLLERLRQGTHHVRDIRDDVAAVRGHYVAAREGAGGTVGEAARVHAVVLNYGTPDDTLIAVRSLLASRLPLAGVHVVDNGSDAACETLLLAVRDRIDYTRTGTNLGFSGGMNVGIRRALAAHATHVLVVNSDAVVPPDTAGRLLEALHRRPDAGIAGPVVVTRTRPDRVQSAGLLYGPGTGRFRVRGFGTRAADAGMLVGDVPAISGCVMLIDRAVLDRVGLFDERYFFGFEDLDFCLRAGAEGFKTIVTNALVYHHGGASLGGRAPARFYYATRNHLHLAGRIGAGDPVARRTLRAVSILALNAAHALRGGPAGATSRAWWVARGALDALRGRDGPLPGNRPSADQRST